MNKLYLALRRNGFTIMLFGFGIAGAGLLAFINYRFADTAAKSLSFYGAIVGFVIYVCGRVLLALQKSADRKQRIAELRQEQDSD